MSRFLLASMLLVVACANKEAPSTTPTEPADATRIEAPDEPAEEPAADAGSADAACSPSEAVLIKESRSALSGSMPEMSTTIYDNGHWALSGPSAKSGCLDEAQLADLKAAVDAAEIVAKPLEPGMARCMAMPIHTVTFEAKGESASWKAPCGESNPTESLGSLQKKIADLTSGQ